MVDGQAGTTLYYEPHCDFEDVDAASVAPVDFVVSPGRSAMLLNAYPLVQGDQSIVNLIKSTKANCLIILRNDTTPATGFLSTIISPKGSNEMVG